MRSRKRDDDPPLALFQDKAGLDHNGGRTAGGGHIVLFVPLMEHKHIPEAGWEGFSEKQRQLLAEARTAIHHDATVQIDNREVKVQVRLVDDYISGSTWDSRQRIATTKEQELGIQSLHRVTAPARRVSTLVPAEILHPQILHPSLV
jgi:hypothetical protein